MQIKISIMSVYFIGLASFSISHCAPLVSIILFYPVALKKITYLGWLLKRFYDGKGVQNPKAPTKI